MHHHFISPLTTKLDMAKTLSPSEPLTQPSVADDPRWTRVIARDKTADGQFWYSVATTGVYCRPSCPSRKPSPKNAQLHDTLESAQRTGYRACKRCYPDHFESADQNVVLITKACRLIEKSETELSLDELAAAVDCSASHFHRLFKAVTGLTPKKYAAAQRAAKMRQNLSEGKSITEAIYDAGFNSSGRFYEKSTDILGMTPTQYRKGGINEQIYFALGVTTLGAILVASSKRGVVSILLGDDPEPLLRELQDRFPRAHLIGADKEYEALVAQVVGYVKSPTLSLKLPLDIRGTAFQQRVWHALQQIPAGQTLSYTELAHRLGIPKAVRAVASACAANKIALAIPCHRVVRNNGLLAGYAWGIERKRELLERESMQAEKAANSDG